MAQAYFKSTDALIDFGLSRVESEALFIVLDSHHQIPGRFPGSSFGGPGARVIRIHGQGFVEVLFSNFVLVEFLVQFRQFDAWIRKTWVFHRPIFQEGKAFIGLPFVD